MNMASPSYYRWLLSPALTPHIRCSRLCQVTTHHQHFSRRHFLKAFAGAGALLPAFAQAPSASSQNTMGKIDVHHHMTPDFYMKVMEKELTGSGFAFRPWEPLLSIDAMDKSGVATALLSPVQRLVMDSMSDKSERARTLARQSNDFGARVVRDYPRRFGLLAALPLPDQDGSLREIEYAFDTLKADGISLWTSYLNKWPGDPAFDRVWEELNRRKAIVFFHPATASCCRNLMPGLQISGIIEYDLDTARAAESMLLNRIPMRFPDIRFIFSHSGGALSVLAARIVDDLPRFVKGVTGAQIEDAFRKFYYETAHASKPAALDAVRDIAPVSQILFGSDVPIREYGLTTEGLEEYRGFSPNDWRAINRGNAERLWPRLKR
jgi:predicted TIM-barrel fold metal-dependent hydrolase